jgi:outer membrane lipoprotein-sorting protein
MRKVCITIVTLILAGNALAQQDIEAKSIITDFSNKVREYTAMQAEFAFSIIDIREDTREDYEGVIFIKGEKFRIKMFDIETYFDGETIWNHLIDVQEVNITKPDEEDKFFLDAPNKIFFPDENEFKFKFVGETYQDNKTVYEIDLFPRHLNQEYSRIRLKINKSNMTLIYVEYVRKDGIRYNIKISNLKANPNLPDSYFTFNIEDHPDVEVIDLR